MLLGWTCTYVCIYLYELRDKCVCREAHIHDLQKYLEVGHGRRHLTGKGGVGNWCKLEHTEALVMRGGQCWTGLAGCGFGWLPGRQELALWMRGHRLRGQEEGDETGQMELESVTGFPRKQAFDSLTPEPRTHCQMVAGILFGTSDAHASRCLTSVHCNYLSDAHNSLLAGEGGIFPPLDRAGRFREVDWLLEGPLTKGDGTTVRRWFPWQSWSPSVQSPCTFFTAPFKALSGSFFSSAPSLDWLLAPFLICLYFPSPLNSARYGVSTFWTKELLAKGRWADLKKKKIEKKNPSLSTHASEITLT